MDRDDFTKPNGTFKANEDGRLTFMPKKLPPRIQYDDKTVMLLAKAERKVGELRGMGDGLASPYSLIRAHLKIDAVLSSKIEGTSTSLDDLNRHETMGGTEKKESEKKRLQEVINYADALESSIKKMESGRRLDLRMLLEAHKKLLENVRGEDKSPGEFRTTQNIISGWKEGRQTVVFRPPAPDMVKGALEDLESFFQAEHEDISPLIQCAMIHYQFEAIHPFRDGNGRIGRLVLPLILCEKQILPRPLLYVSAYFERHLEEYYDGLLAVSQKSEWGEWIKYFLRAFAEQADIAIRNIQKIEEAGKRYRGALASKKSAKAMFLIDSLVSNPVITVPAAQKILDTTYPTAKSAITALIEAGILSEIGAIRGKKAFLAKEIDEVLKS